MSDCAVLNANKFHMLLTILEQYGISEKKRRCDARQCANLLRHVSHVCFNRVFRNQPRLQCDSLINPHFFNIVAHAAEKSPGIIGNAAMRLWHVLLSAHGDVFARIPGDHLRRIVRIAGTALAQTVIDNDAAEPQYVANKASTAFYAQDGVEGTSSAATQSQQLDFADIPDNDEDSASTKNARARFGDALVDSSRLAVLLADIPAARPASIRAVFDVLYLHLLAFRCPEALNCGTPMLCGPCPLCAAAGKLLQQKATAGPRGAPMLLLPRDIHVAVVLCLSSLHDPHLLFNFLSAVLYTPASQRLPGRDAYFDDSATAGELLNAAAALSEKFEDLVERVHSTCQARACGALLASLCRLAQNALTVKDVVFGPLRTALSLCERFSTGPARNILEGPALALALVSIDDIMQNEIILAELWPLLLRACTRIADGESDWSRERVLSNIACRLLSHPDVCRQVQHPPWRDTVEHLGRAATAITRLRYQQTSDKTAQVVRLVATVLDSQM